MIMIGIHFYFDTRFQILTISLGNEAQNINNLWQVA